MSTIAVTRPGPGEYAPPFERYVSRVGETDVLDALRAQKDQLAAVLGHIAGPAAERHLYAPEKWSVRELVGHVIDSERVFGYRACCVARGEQGPLPGFDENDYAAHSPADRIPLGELLQELLLVREGHLAFFRHLDAPAWTRTGMANGHPTSVRALAYIMVGHVRHHLAVLEERYLPTLPA
jgi:hypothetical protein